MIGALRALWNYRGFILRSISREFNSRYRESLLGGFWAVANPLTMIIIYTVIFGRLMRPSLAGSENIPFAFSIYLCAGTFTWGLMSEMLIRLNNVFLDNANMLKKASFPRICLPAIVTGSALLNFAIIFGLFLIFLGLVQHWPGWLLLVFLPVLFIQIVFSVGLGVFLGTINVFFRDVGQFTGIVLQFWFWLTPIVYTSTALPPHVKELLLLNPMAPVILAYQEIFLYSRAPSFISLLPFSILAVLMLFLGFYVFLSRVGDLVDEL
jgi:lipopolysaccharide transport system permease protein